MDETVQTAGSSEQIRFANRVQVLRAFLEEGVSSAGAVAERVGLSRQTVMKAIQFFHRTGLLTSVGKGSSTSLGGKRPELFELTKDRYFLSITLWPEAQHLRLVTIGGSSVAELVRQEPLAEDGKEALRRVGRQSAELVRDRGLRSEQIVGVSISVPGLVDYGTGTLRCSSRFPGWGSGVALKEHLAYWFPDAMILTENTGRMAALPLLSDRELAGKRVLVLFDAGGLSGCLMDRGQILGCGDPMIGEIGHMTVDPVDGELCGCGSRGCLERLVSPERVREKAGQWAAECPPETLPPLEELTIPAVFRASEAGDPLGRRLSDYLADCFAVALRSVSLVFDPETVVFRGDYAHADDRFRRTLLDRLGSFRFFAPGGPFELRFDRRELTAMDAQGSKLLLTDRYFSRPELYMD